MNIFDVIFTFLDINSQKNPTTSQNNIGDLGMKARMIKYYILSKLTSLDFQYFYFSKVRLIIGGEVY